MSPASLTHPHPLSLSLPPQVNIDHETRDITRANLRSPSASCFDLAQHKIYTLMEKDCYPRFLRSAAYRDMTAPGGGAKQARPGKKVRAGLRVKRRFRRTTRGGGVETNDARAAMDGARGGLEVP